MTDTRDIDPDRREANAAQLVARPERRLIRSGGSARHVDFHIRVGQTPRQRERPAIRLALVLDRSGSMAAGKLDMAKRAALVVLDRLDERDTVAVVAFDEQIDILGEAQRLTTDVKRRLRAAIGKLEPRASTALHEGWLSGCNAIVDDAAFVTGTTARCFLLTDGLANVGVTDPEQIASDASGLRGRAGIGTSTFGIGADYDENLLGPMAVAGGGQFYHLRRPEEIVATFVGELSDLLATAVARVRLEIEGDAGVKVDMVSQYALRPLGDDRGWEADLGDLVGGEERHVIARMLFPRRSSIEGFEVRARLHWFAEGQEWTSTWERMTFTYARSAACDAEAPDAGVMHWVGLHHADRARLEAAALSRRGESEAARRRLVGVSKRIAGYAGNDSELLGALEGLRELDASLAFAPLDSMAAKEESFRAMRATSSRPDHRGNR